ncbi:MAG: type IV secretion system protein VirB10 [Hydrogenophaga sp.]|uniref:type IV secretion system protein VirB10 n=1 Tax=Hydrogenophaga sp. TaxID=1904254 RepID=UPI002768AAE9|nr:type IV secretion system protein VirB10 [Hydrogenophaga sp.]MDP2263744.1 type IV secretion system protein VirB10 [Hydrogenophaga sp.]MDZ4283853.1 type IV secretion system protein VirB10 [Hydrogenophaga sp.]
MNDRDVPAGLPSAEPSAETDGNTITPLPGEAGIPNVAARQRVSWSAKGLLAVALLMLSLIAVSAFSIHRFAASGHDADKEASKLAHDLPSAATTEPRRLDMAVVAPLSSPRIPALLPTANEVAEPIGVRRTGEAAPTSGGPKGVQPEDAPVLLVSSRPGAPPSSSGVTPQRQVAAAPIPEAGAARGIGEGPIDPDDPLAATSRNLQAYQRQLQGLLDDLTQSAAIATGQNSGPVPSPAMAGGPMGASAPPAAAGLFGGQLQGSATPRVAATLLGDRSLTLPKGTAFTCALKTKVISATSGLVGCQVQRNVFGDNGRVLLIERGSHLDGEYRIASVRPGTVRIPVLWTRIRTPLGVTVEIDSPGTGQLGESGIDGYVDNRWGERIGAAMLLSLIDDSVKLVIQNQAQDQEANTIILPSTTSNTSKLAEKVLDSTINIPPLIYQNQGGIVGIYVARDVDFSSVYELRPVER